MFCFSCKWQEKKVFWDGYRVTKSLYCQSQLNEMIHLSYYYEFPTNYLQREQGKLHILFLRTKKRKWTYCTWCFLSSHISDSQLHPSIMKGKKRRLKFPAFTDYPTWRIKFQTVQPYPFHFILLRYTGKTQLCAICRLSENRKQTAREERSLSVWLGKNQRMATGLTHTSFSHFNVFTTYSKQSLIKTSTSLISHWTNFSCASN